MGRAVLKVADALVGVILADGVRAVKPTTPIRDLQVVDARFRGWCIELLIESATLPGPADATLDNAPTINVTMQRVPVLEGDEALELVADHMRNAEGYCDCGKLGLSTPYTCPTCRSRAALQRVPTVIHDMAAAMRKVAGEETKPWPPAAGEPQVPASDPDPTDASGTHAE